MADDDTTGGDGYTHFPPDWLERMPFLQKYEGQRIRTASDYLRGLVYERDGGICHYCQAPVSRRAFQADHKLAFSRGGLTVLSNLVCSCRRCNLAKGNADYDQFVAELAAKGLAWRDEVAQAQANWFDYQNRLANGQI